jgi:transposase InsO family protein
MAQTLPNSAVEERMRWIKPYLSGKRSLTDIAEISPFSYRTLKRWVALYLKHGIKGLIPKSRRPHHHPNEYPEELIEKIRALRLETQLGPDVLTILLRKEGIKVSHSGIGKLLKREGLSRKGKRIQKKEKWVRKATYPGELVEIDVIYVRKFKGNWLFQYTAIDSCTRWKYSWITPEQSNRTAVIFLEKVIQNAPFKIIGIKTDNASIFTNRYTGYSKSTDPLNPRIHIFDRICLKYGIIHYLIDPGKPQQNGKVERSHRTDRERFWNKVQFRSLEELELKQKEYLMWYNRECPHLGIQGLTPEEKLHSLQGTNVRV